MSERNLEEAAAGRVATRRRLFGFVREATATFREKGLRGILRAYGWKLFAVFFVFYLVRDVTLYIVLPYLAARGLWSLWK